MSTKRIFALMILAVLAQTAVMQALFRAGQSQAKPLPAYESWRNGFDEGFVLGRERGCNESLERALRDLFGTNGAGVTAETWDATHFDTQPPPPPWPPASP